MLYFPDPCSSIDCHPFATCAYEATGAPICECPQESSCPNTQSTVCGSDGKSYKNSCLMRTAACQKNEDITAKHSGTCSEFFYFSLYSLVITMSCTAKSYKVVSDC